MQQIADIEMYLQHQDYSLAVRRMLDLALEINDKKLIRHALDWSRTYSRSREMQQDVPENFREEALSLLQEAAQHPAPRVLADQALVEAKSISKAYSKGGFVMKPVDLTVYSGQIIGVVGENGNGKTTLLRSIAGQLAINSGSLEYSLLRNPDYYDVKSYVVFMPQRIPRWYGLLQDNLHFSASIAGVHGDENELMVECMLERLGLTRFRNLTWDQISSGYRTRFELARILLQKPQLLILDEPLSNLDINAQQTILTDLKFIAKSAYNPLGVLLSSQQLHEVEKIADDVLFIKNGQTIYRNREIIESKSALATIEVESPASRDEIAKALQGVASDISFNGGFYTIVSASHSATQLMRMIFDAEITVTYMRDISKSTKRFF